MKTMYIIITIVLVLAGTFYFLFPWRWSKHNPNWTIKSDQEISEARYTMSTTNDSDIVTATVYIKTDRGNMKLNPKDIITVNGKIMNSEYYNNGIAVGYRYLLDLEKSNEYVLSIKREGKEEVKKIVKPFEFSFTIPSKISKKTGISMAYMSDVPDEELNLFTDFSSLSEESIIINKPYNRGLTVEAITKNKTITLDSESLKTLKNGKMLLYIGMTSKQTDGVFVSGNEKEVEIID